MRRSGAFGETQFFLRLWHGQFSFWRMDAPMCASRELRAMELAREAGVPVTSPLRTASGVPVRGLCERPLSSAGRHGALVEFVALKCVPHARDGRGGPVAVRPDGQKLVIEMMARLHSLSLAGRDTSPLARFDSPLEQISYLRSTAAECDRPLVLAAVEKVATLFEAPDAPPPLPPALLHFDYNRGNLLCDYHGQLAALIDWEDAAIADSRLDVARFVLVCRHSPR